MREALWAVCATLFDAGIVRRFETEVDPPTRPRAHCSAAGLQPRGPLRQRWAAKGRVYDVDAWGLLAGELIRR